MAANANLHKSRITGGPYPRTLHIQQISLSSDATRRSVSTGVATRIESRRRCGCGGSDSLLLIALVLRRVVEDRFLDEDDPRRQYIAQIILYGGTFIVIALTVWRRHRP